MARQVLQAKGGYAPLGLPPPTLGASRGTRDAPRSRALAERGLGGGLARAHAVGDADAAVGRAGEMEPGEHGGGALDRLDVYQVADPVLRHRRRPARRAHEHRLGGPPPRPPPPPPPPPPEGRVRPPPR